ncbi:MAG: DNA polymerase III [Thermobacillus sp. ZCTH02-B1]|uniref:3'-5' exonuclease n=1 Tax=Thermobacillus sp. ZCTH02-B1 TaxID=1858795 RepID=UPI000B54E6A8|nr:3'-5' exonuclease [Thermobacillus sp. ZCTH02-B1]OUM95172.1 MAG: DNA polymerase III [Thermobacillus sp. ZCTH02-B1]
MHYVILDIEFNGRKFASDLPMEVIEIGAVRLDRELRENGTFTSLIRPIYFPKLNRFIREKTGITQEEIDRAGRFPAVIASFIRWLGPPDSYLLVTWGGEDLKRIVLDTRMHKLDDSYWLSVRYYDLLKGFLRVHDLKSDVSVERALEMLGLPNRGKAHRALEDAIMTAGIFRALHPRLDLDRVRQYRDTFTNAKERRMVKSAIRIMRMRGAEPDWDTVEEQFLKNKIDLANERKREELRAYFEEELRKAGQSEPQ